MSTIRDQLNEIERTTARLDEKQTRADEDRRALFKKVNELGDEIAEVLSLGALVHQMEETLNSNTAKIAVIEEWRQRKIGAAGLLHTLGAAFGAVVGALIERWAGGQHH